MRSLCCKVEHIHGKQTKLNLYKKLDLIKEFIKEEIERSFTVNLVPVQKIAKPVIESPPKALVPSSKINLVPSRLHKKLKTQPIINTEKSLIPN